MRRQVAQSLGSRYRVSSSADMDKCLAWIATFLCLLLLVEAMAEASPYSVAGEEAVGSGASAETDPYEFCRAHFGADFALNREVRRATNSVEKQPHEPRDDLDDYNDNLARLLFFTRKRSCIRRGGSCDHRPNDCCYNSSCRCNLWGTNCRCQRMGLFQKWGKK
ncbi:uncharacterized protein [Dermacentor albipictus]|uniref:uncharacterized protein isoform X1 n=2 Tax=Dermacentor albipictus TaxID=60249 RepID=UPI0038FD32FD